MNIEPSVAVYDARAEQWQSRRSRQYDDRLANFATRVADGGDPGAPVADRPVADLGCGPGWHLDGLPQPVVALDASRSMLNLVGAAPPEELVGGPTPEEFVGGPTPGSGGPTPEEFVGGPTPEEFVGGPTPGSGGPTPGGGGPTPGSDGATPGSGGATAAAVEAPWRVAGDLRALPLRAGCLRGAWASRSYVHLPRSEVPLALADLHRALAPGAAVELHLFEGDAEWSQNPDDDFPGRRFSRWPLPWLSDVLTGAGLASDDIERRNKVLLVATRRRHTLPDTVGAGMRLLVCGLNPSGYAAEAGVGFARPGNRFWPAALATGLVSRDRDPRHALLAHGIGMTDLVKRPTSRADELSAEEYATGLARLERMAARLTPGAVCFVGLAGWRAVVDRRAAPGPQTERIGGRPTYLMPSTSGLNAHSNLADLTAHLEAAAALADAEPT